MDATTAHLIARGLLVFVLMFLTDFFYAKYTQAVTKRLKTWAATHAGILYLLSGLVTLSYVSAPWLLGPAIAGAFCGTYAAMQMEKE